MFIYLLIATFFFVAAYTKNARGCFLIGIITLFCFSAFRNVETLGGFDAQNYARIFNNTDAFISISHSLSVDSQYSVGYILFNAIVRIFSDNYRDFQIVYILCTTIVLYMVLKKTKLNYRELCLFLFAYFCFRYLWYEWVLLRQNIANLIFWLCIVTAYISDSKYRKRTYIVLALIVPPLFHTSAILNFIFLPIMYVSRLLNDTMRKYLIPILSVFVFILSSFIVSSFFPYLVGFVDDRYADYSISNVGNGNIINYGVRFLVYYILVFHYEREDYPYKDLVRDCMFMVLMIGSVNFSSANRLYEYYAIGMYIGFAVIPKYYPNVILRSVYYVFFIVTLARFLSLSLEGSLLNYSTWL